MAFPSKMEKFADKTSFVRIRIFRIGGIFRISLVPLALFDSTENPANFDVP